MWKAFFQSLFERLLSPQTARFILALLALGAAVFGANKLLDVKNKLDTSQAAVFAVGQLFALASLAFGYYFGSTAKGDDGSTATVKIDQPANQPVPVNDTGESK
jgi:hypothetical protein